MHSNIIRQERKKELLFPFGLQKNETVWMYNHFQTLVRVLQNLDIIAVIGVIFNCGMAKTWNHPMLFERVPISQSSSPANPLWGLYLGLSKNQMSTMGLSSHLKRAPQAQVRILRSGLMLCLRGWVLSFTKTVLCISVE